MSGSGHNPPTPEQGGDPSMEDILASIRRILNEEEPHAAATADPAAAPPTGILTGPPTEVPTGFGGSVLDLTPAMRVAPPPNADAAAMSPISMPVPPLATSVPPMPEPRPEPAPQPVHITPFSVPEAVIPEAAFAQPGIPEPVTVQPVMVQPVIPEPVIPEPAVSEPAVSEPAISKPVMARPILREPFVRDFGASILPPSPEAKPSSPEAKPMGPEAKPVGPEAKPSSLVAPAAAAAAAASMGELVRRLAGTQNVPIIRGGPTIEDLVREEIRGLLKAWLDENLPRIVERLVRAEIERVVGREVG